MRRSRLRTTSRRAIDEALADPRPSLIRCKTIIGYGAPNKQGTAATHGAALGADEVAAARAELGWDLPAFAVPDDVLSAWREAGAQRRRRHAEWRRRLEASGKKRRVPCAAWPARPTRAG